MAAFEDNLPYHAWGSRYLNLESPVMQGTDVKVFQTLFNDFLQYSAPPLGPMGTPLAADGIFGPKTSEAVRQWQQYFGLSNDGVIGPVTGATLGQDDGAYGGPRFGSCALAVGASGGDVYVLQNRLDCYEYWHYFAAANGQFDLGVEDALRHFQDSMNTYGTDPGVPEDGQVHYTTRPSMLFGPTRTSGAGIFMSAAMASTHSGCSVFCTVKRSASGRSTGTSGPALKRRFRPFKRPWGSARTASSVP